MRVAIVGPGRVGGALALALAHAGHDVVALVPGDPASASLARARSLVPQAAVVALADLPRDVDLVVVTTPDDQVAAVARAAGAADVVAPGQRWVHIAGGLGLDALAVVRAAGGRVAACHPAMTVPDPERGYANLPGASWAVTAEDADLGWARTLVLDLRGSPVTLAADDRTLYHAGLTLGSNATTAVVAMARDLLLGAGVEDPAAFLVPLVTASAEGGARRGVEALTGPVRRGDHGTVRAHLGELRRSFPEAVEAYVALCDLLLRQSVRAGLDAERAAAVRAVLDEVRG
ncbi:Rossmann-like and DUF2520 domain-containing protein [Euzebya sp.]|uniref:Rossmann-like and DUF2520 domain-containing protein n=1 Tax=Euzebya sp. TaxID=1971409 RepID=UPI003513FCD6